MQQVFLKPAEFYIATAPTAIITVLGSCVAVTMYSRRAGIAAMCHAVLPVCAELECRPRLCPSKAKYLTCILPEMIRAFRDKKVPLAEIEIGVFGGASMFSMKRGAGLEQTVGWRNVQAGLELLEAMGMKVSVRHLGGTVGRKIRFETGTGRILVRKQLGILDSKVIDGTISGKIGVEKATGRGMAGKQQAIAESKATVNIHKAKGLPKRRHM